MPSALSNHVSSMPDISTTSTSTSTSTPTPAARERSTESIVGRMDGAVRRKASEVVAGAARDRAAQKEADQPVAAPAAEDAPEGHVHKPQPHKHSLDYVTRSFIAGGVAGCAVRVSTQDRQARNQPPPLPSEAYSSGML